MTPITPERLTKPDHYRNQVQMRKEDKLFFSALHSFSAHYLSNHSETRDKRAPQILQDFIEAVRKATTENSVFADALSGFIYDSYTGERFTEVVRKLKENGIPFE